jgi:prepilin-type N-terminal cleavage/methylation domain-containing protein
MARAYNYGEAPGMPRQTGALCFGFVPSMAGKRAFTLVEVLVGAAILAFTVVALYGAFSFGFSTIKLSQEDVRADQILVQKLETLRVYDWSKVTNNFLPTNFTSTFSTTGADTGVTYSGSLSITAFVPSAANESYSDSLRRVIASVEWTSSGILRKRSMTTFVSQYGIQNYKP